MLQCVLLNNVKAFFFYLFNVILLQCSEIKGKEEKLCVFRIWLELSEIRFGIYRTSLTAFTSCQCHFCVLVTSKRFFVHSSPFKASTRETFFFFNWFFLRWFLNFPFFLFERHNATIKNHCRLWFLSCPVNFGIDSSGIVVKLNQNKFLSYLFNGFCDLIYYSIDISL